MAKCPKCGAILSDEWLKKEGASLMGKAKGKAKRRSNASEAAHQRWAPKKKKAKPKKKT
jgi:hypothetical protein